MQDAQAAQWMQDQLAQLRTLRDEVRGLLHVASNEAQGTWERLEPLIDDAEWLAEDVSPLSLQVVGAMVRRVRSFRATLMARHSVH